MGKYLPTSSVEKFQHDGLHSSQCWLPGVSCLDFKIWAGQEMTLEIFRGKLVMTLSIHWLFQTSEKYPNL